MTGYWFGLVLSVSCLVGVYHSVFSAMIKDGYVRHLSVYFEGFQEHCIGGYGQVQVDH